MRIDQWVRYNILASFFNIGLDITIYAHPRLYNIVYTLDSPKNLPARTAWPATKDLQDEDLTETESSQLKELVGATIKIFIHRSIPILHQMGQIF
jgi:hypothetical protein